MSTTTTLDNTFAGLKTLRHPDDLVVDLDRQDSTLKIDPEFSEFEARFHAPAAVREIALDAVEQATETPAVAIAELTSVDMRELILGIAAYSVEASCQVIALAAALPFVPRFIGRPIYKPLVRRLQA